MPYAPLLSQAEIDQGLSRLPDWQREGDWLVRTFRRDPKTRGEFLTFIGRTSDR